MKEENYDSEAERKFFDYLLEIGYPRDAIVYQPPFFAGDNGRRYQPDFLIVDPKTDERLAIIELKGAYLKNASRTYEHLKAYSNAIGEQRIPVFLVTPTNHMPPEAPFDLWLFGLNGELQKSSLQLLPTFTALQTEDIADRKSSLRMERARNADRFRCVCWFLAFVLLVAVIGDFIADFWDIEVLTTERMTIIGVSVALLILPYAQKFKWLGVEFEKIGSK